MEELCHAEKKDKTKLFLIKLVCGLKVDGKKLFDIETEEDISFSFEDFSYEEKEEELVSILGEEYYGVVEIARQLHDAGALAEILHGSISTYLSFARVETYEKHHRDLKNLKSVYHQNQMTEEYDRMFRSDEPGSYGAYVKSVNSSCYQDSPSRRGSKADERSRENLYKQIEKDLSGLDDVKVEQIRNDIKNGIFLPKQLTSDNGVIPCQIHARELRKILDNAQQYLPFLCEVDPSCGLTAGEKIIRLFSFQIPYYVGPLTEKSAADNGNGWVVRKEPGKVYPWNLAEKVDMDKTQEKFIKHLVRDCTYLSGEKVLPKASLLYEKYTVLNEINNLRISGEKISVEAKQTIYQELFCRKTRVTRKHIAQLLMNMGLMQESSQLTGIDANVNNQLSSYGKFVAIFGDKLKEDRYFCAAERIIELATIYGDAKKTLRKRLQEEFGEILDDAQIKRILGFRFTGWGRLSRALLELSGCDRTTGEIRSLIQVMWDTNDNFMEIINNDQYTYKEELEKKKKKINKSLFEFQPEDLDEYYFSAPVRRMINQSILLLKEIVRVMGCEPAKIFVEMTRKDGVKGNLGRKDSRGKELLDLYRNIKEETDDWVREIAGEKNWSSEIAASGESGQLKSKKLYLYYRQMGRCMYTGHPIELSELLDSRSNRYDIDHIYPRQFVKDDNINNNLVLVEKESNAYKSNHYPLGKMDANVYELWQALHKNGFINDEKYKRLMSKEELTEEKKAGFIARQLVETGQATKGITDLLRQLMPDTTRVIYVKGSNVSEFRHEFGFLKSRLANDFHHAKDAYLNIVVGNVYDTKFTANPLNFIKNEYALDTEKNHYNLDKMFVWDVKRKGKIAWIGLTDRENKCGGTIETVRKVMSRNTPFMTRMSYVNTGAFAKETLYGAKESKAGLYAPQKTSDERLRDVTKYGGYSDIATGYFFVAEHLMKGKKVRTVEVVPSYMVAKIGEDERELLIYCETVLGLAEPKIVWKKIAIKSLVSRDGYRMYASGKANGGDRIVCWNAVNLCLNQSNINYIREIEKYIENGIVTEKITKERNAELYKTLLHKHTVEIYARKPGSIGKVLQDGHETFNRISVEEQCYTLHQILTITSIGKAEIDLRAIGGRKKVGATNVGKTLSEKNHLYLINQSVTGIYEQVIDLLTV
jgi:CRISPR-associated endonuclease Csn1